MTDDGDGDMVRVAARGFGDGDRLQLQIRRSFDQRPDHPRQVQALHRRQHDRFFWKYNGPGLMLRGAINPEPGGTQHHVVEVKRRFLFMTPRVFVDGAELERIK
jgi:hypothetical protein